MNNAEYNFDNSYVHIILIGCYHSYSNKDVDHFVRICVIQWRPCEQQMLIIYHAILVGGVININDMPFAPIDNIFATFF